MLRTNIPSLFCLSFLVTAVCIPNFKADLFIQMTEVLLNLLSSLQPPGVGGWVRGGAPPAGERVHLQAVLKEKSFAVLILSFAVLWIVKMC